MAKIEDIIAIIRGLLVSKFYGSITIRFEAGKIVHIKKEESIKV